MDDVILSHNGLNDSVTLRSSLAAVSSRLTPL